MHKKFEINRTKIKGSCQLESKVVTHNSESDLPLDAVYIWSVNNKRIHIVCVLTLTGPGGLLSSVSPVCQRDLLTVMKRYLLK